MTIYDNGLLRAMKAAYRDGGYDVAFTETGILIQTDGWGVQMEAGAVPNSIKSLIVLHNGSLPRIDSAVCVSKGECSDVILNMVTTTMDYLYNQHIASGGLKPTRLTFDGKRVWQLAEKLDIRLVDAENQQIPMTMFGEKVDALLLGSAIYSRLPYGSLYIQTETPVPEDQPLLQHLSQMQWIAVELD